MFRIGWRVFRERLPEVVSARRRRRLVVVGSLVAVLALVGLTALGLVTGQHHAGVPVAVAVVVLLSLSVAVGCFAAAFCPLGPKGWTIPPIPSIGWRTQEAVARYYRRDPPPIAPEHRDVVLENMDATRDSMVRATLRGWLLLSGWVCVFVALLLFEIFSDVHHGSFVSLPIWSVAAGGTTGVGLRTLGRQDQVRREAEALPPVPPAPPRRGRPDAPRGSKLSLPGE